MNTKAPSLARNAVLSFSAQVFPAAVAVICIPLAVKVLGTDRFGLLSIILVIMGYLSVLDLGLGVAVTKLLAEAIASHAEIRRVTGIFWTALLTQLGMGTLGAAGLIFLTSDLTKHVFKIPAALSGEASAALYLCAVALPIVMGSSSVVGLLQAAQRFDLTVRVQLPMSVAQYAIPLVCGLIRPNLVLVVSALLACRAVGFWILFWLGTRVFSGLLSQFRLGKDEFRALLRFGGWITVSNTISPVMVYADRFLIGTLISISAVSYYSVPLDAAMRILLIPTSLVTALFPFLSSMSVSESTVRVTSVVKRALKYIICFTGVPVVLLIVFAGDLLRLFLGAHFAEVSTGILQVLLIGILANSVERIPLALLQASDRPDVLVKFYFFAAPVQLALAWVLLKRIGLIGAAIAWTARLVIETGYLFACAQRFTRISFSQMASGEIAAATLWLPLFGALGCLGLLTSNQLIFRAALCAVMMAVGAAGTWGYFLNSQERSMIMRAIRGRLV